MARVEIEQGKWTSAERRLELLVAATPDYWAAYLLLGVINSNQAQLGQAEMYLRRAANGNPRDSSAQLLLADVYIRQDEIDEAREVLEGAEDANDPLFLALAGRASLEAGQTELAAEYFDRSERDSPRQLRDLIDIANVYVAAGQLDRATRILEGASFGEAESGRVATYLLTLVQLRRGNLVGAAAVARRLGDDTPESLNLQGTIALMRNDASRARQLFERAKAIDPRYVPALLNLARVAIARNDKATAAQHLRSIIETDPEQLNAIFGLVQLAAERRDFAEAETWLARAPDSVLRFRMAGQLHLAQRRFDDAAADFARAFGIRPSGDLAVRIFTAERLAGRDEPESVLLQWVTDHPHDVPANYALGSLAMEAGELPEAVARYEAVLAAAPRHAATLNNLAWTYYRLGDPRALEFAKRAHDEAPEDASIADTLGWLYVVGGNPEVGLPLLEQAVRANPGHPTILYHLGAALADTGARVRSIEVLERLLRDEPNFPERADAAQRLEQLRSSKD
jgi:tetratricopeptide (TPR) repeat protein